VRHYIALVRKDPESSFGVEFPDFPGCISAGDTLDEAARGAAEALQLHVDGMIEDGEDIPAPSSLDDISTEGAMVTLVPLREQRGRVLRLNITMDEGLLQAVDQAAAKRGQNRSAFLAEAARAAL
jgi:predicted RNase H-like HicB family nuclease